MGLRKGSSRLNNVSSTCIKLNWWRLVIMNALMDLRDRSGAQAIGNSFVACLFFCSKVCLHLVFQVFSPLCFIPSVCPSLFCHAASSPLLSNLEFTFIKTTSNGPESKTKEKKNPSLSLWTHEPLFHFLFLWIFNSCPVRGPLPWLFAAGLWAAQRPRSSQKYVPKHWSHDTNSSASLGQAT